MEDSTKTFLDKIQGLNDKKIEVFSLSQKKKIDCSPLSFKQQKDLISTIADGSVGALKFQKHINDLILTNTGQDLKITDKLPIVLALRVNAIGGDIKFDDVIVDFQQSVKKAEKLKFKDKITIKGDVTINVEVPTLKQETQVINTLIESIKKDGDAVAKSVGDIYTYEIAKYITSVEFGEETLKFQDISVRDRIKIVENLPLSLNKQVVDFIQNIRKIENDILVVDVDGEVKSFDIDVTFFDG